MFSNSFRTVPPARFRCFSRVTENRCDSAVEPCPTDGTDDGKSAIIAYLYPADIDVVPARVFIAVIVGFTVPCGI